MSSYIISAAERGGVYRHIRISSEATLLDLHKAIVSAYRVDDFRHPSFTPQYLAKGKKPVKYSTNNTKTTVAMRDVRLEDTGLAARGILIYSLSSPGLTLRCRTLEILEEPTPEPQVVRASGAFYDFKFNFNRLFRALDERLAAEKVMRAAFGAEDLPLEVEDTLATYFLAASNLYGLVPLQTVHRLYRRNHSAPDLTGFTKFGMTFSQRDQTRFYILDKEGKALDRKDSDPGRAEYIAEYSVYESRSFALVLGMQEGKPFYLPDEEEFLRYADEDYHEENEHYLRLRSYLLDHGLIPKKAKRCMEDLVDSAQLPTDDPDEFSEILADHKVRLKDPKSARQALYLFSQLSSNTRSHINCGHTPNEINALQADRHADPSAENVIPPQFPYVAPPKPGRNEPCPCGSGKKYKHCCGKPGSVPGTRDTNR